jgi:hypothetical protein
LVYCEKFSIISRPHGTPRTLEKRKKASIAARIMFSSYFRRPKTILTIIHVYEKLIFSLCAYTNRKNNWEVEFIIDARLEMLNPYLGIG